MDMQQYAGSESKYLKASDLQGKRIKVTIDNVELVEFENDGKTQRKPALSLRGKEKKLVCNATTVNDLGEAYGWDSDSWIGKTVGLGTKMYPQLGKEGLVIEILDKPQFTEDSDIPF